MAIRRELIDELLNEYEMPQDILGEGGLLKEVDDAYPSLETRPHWFAVECAERFLNDQKLIEVWSSLLP